MDSNDLKIKKSVISVLLGTFAGYRNHLILLAILGILGAVLEGVGINAIIPLFSFLLGDGDVVSGDFISGAIRNLFSVLGVPFSFRFLLVFIAILFLFRAVVITIFTYLRARITSSFMFRETNSMLVDTVRAKWEFLSLQKAGYLQNTLFWDVRQSTSLLDSVAQFVQSSTGFIIYFFVALSISPVVTLATLAAGAVLLFGLQPLVRKTVGLGEEKSMLEKSFANYLVEHISGFKVIKAGGIGQQVIEAGARILNPLRAVFVRSALMHSLGTAVIQPFSIVFILVIFSFAYKLPSFNIAAFAAVLYLIQKIFVYLQSTQSSIHSIADFIPFADNILKFKESLALYRDELAEDKKLPFSFQDSLTFKNVSFSYQRQNSQTLSNISFSIPRNSFTGIMGPSGGGKTSIVDLILRLFSPDQGSIVLDDTPISQIKIDEWRRSIGYVSQDIFLMNASVRENIKFYNNAMSDEVVVDAARKANIYEHIISLPHGFDTVVGEHGITLSVGQRQRIVIARALARSPSILILDEATSALDSESELAIKQTIKSIRASMTLIVIAHRVSSLTDADNIIVLKNGCIVDSGSPQIMLARADSYLTNMTELQQHTSS